MKKLTATLTSACLLILSSATMAAVYQEVSVSNGGTIIGRVTAEKDYAPKVYRVAKDNAVCGEGKREIDFVKVKDGALQDSVVYLSDITAGKPFPKEIGNITVVQEGCVFSPFLGVMRNEAKLDSINNDSVLHNIHTYELLGRVKKTVFNVSQPDKGKITKSVKLKRGAAMKVECDAHDFMHSYVFVAKNPYFAVVNPDGSYQIDNVPPGRYRINAWHGYLRDLKAEVEVTAGGTATVDFTFKGK